MIMKPHIYSFSKNSLKNIFQTAFSNNNIADIILNKTLIITFLLTSITFIGKSQNYSQDSLKYSISSNISQQIEPLNIFYDAVNDKFVIENNSKQNHNLNFGIYNITGTPIKQYQLETLSSKTLEIPIELNSGIYIVNVTDKSYTFTKKFIIR